MKIYNPYSEIAGKKSFKGDLHFHSNRSDGKCSPEEMFDRLIECGFDFCCLADHDNPNTEILSHRKLLILPGQECSDENGHIVALNTQTARDIKWDIKTQLEWVSASGGYPILSHPKIREFVRPQELAYSPKRLIVELGGFYPGMEIYTHNVGSGFKLAIDRLDAVWNSKFPILGPGSGDSISPVWGFASSDGHHVSHISENVGILVWADELSDNSIMEAINAGRFYSLANTKARFSSISVENDCLTAVASDVIMIRIVCWKNRIAAVKCQKSSGELMLSYQMDGDENFIRIEAMDDSGHCAYSNPVFKEKS